MYIAWPIHSATASNIVISIDAPSPVVPRRTSAASVPENAYMPAAMSASGEPAFTGVSGVPVTEISPASAWTSMS